MNKGIIYMILGLLLMVFPVVVFINIVNSDKIELRGEIKDVGYYDGKHAFFYGFIEDKGVRTKIRFDLKDYDKIKSGQKLIGREVILPYEHFNITGKKLEGVHYSEILLLPYMQLISITSFLCSIAFLIIGAYKLSENDE